MWTAPLTWCISRGIATHPSYASRQLFSIVPHNNQFYRSDIENPSETLRCRKKSPSRREWWTWWWTENCNRHRFAILTTPCIPRWWSHQMAYFQLKKKRQLFIISTYEGYKLSAFTWLYMDGTRYSYPNCPHEYSKLRRRTQTQTATSHWCHNSR